MGMQMYIYKCVCKIKYFNFCKLFTSIIIVVNKQVTKLYMLSTIGNAVK